MYALAASAAGIGILALSPSAEAKVVYTPAHKWLPINENFPLNFNHSEVSFELRLTSTAGPTFLDHSLTIRGLGSSDNIYTSDPSFHWAPALPAGKIVGPKSPGLRNRSTGAYLFVDFANANSGGSFGPWLNIKGQAYLGLRFAIKGTIHYGWARLGNVSYEKPVKALLTGYAYETIPGKAIITGVTSSTDTPAVHSTLGDLAHGRK
jgi:hypothetical protein